MAKYGNENFKPIHIRDAFLFERGNVKGFATQGGETGTSEVIGPNSNPGAWPDAPCVIGVYTAFGAASQQGNIRSVDSELLFNFGGSTAVVSSGSIAAVRGGVSVAGGTTITAGYLYGVQGKYILQGTLNTTNGEYQAAVFAQLDTSKSTATYTAGTLTALWVDAGASSHLTSGQFDMVDITNSTGVNARGVVNFFGSASDLFILNTDNAASGSFLRPVTTVSSMVGSMAISYWNGSAMVTGYIPIYAS